MVPSKNGRCFLAETASAPDRLFFSRLVRARTPFGGAHGGLRGHVHPQWAVVHHPTRSHKYSSGRVEPCCTRTWPCELAAGRGVWAWPGGRAVRAGPFRAQCDLVAQLHASHKVLSSGCAVCVCACDLRRKKSSVKGFSPSTGPHLAHRRARLPAFTDKVL